MTEQYQDPQVNDDADDTEGHLRARAAADDPLRADEMADDTEGHSRRIVMDDGDGDDTEGHLRKPR